MTPRGPGIIAIFAAALGCTGGADLPPTLSDTPNIVIVSADSLRADRLSPFNPDAPAATPHLARLARRGVVFRNAWATAPWTAPSLVSIFTGLYPPSHGVIHRDETTSVDLPTLPRMLSDMDYRLGNFSFFSGVSYYRNLGFPAPDAALNHARPPLAFKEWIDPSLPFLAWIHLIEPHLPYGAAGYRATSITLSGSSGLEQSQLQCEVPLGSVSFSDGDRDQLLRLYDHDLETMDDALGKIIRVLRNAGVLDRTIIVFIADHGEELLENGWIGHASTAIEAKLIPEVLRIPLIIAGPGVPSGVVTETMIQQVDVLPILCELLKRPFPGPVDGSVVRFEIDAVQGDRSLAFFDSSAGGNLTPADRRSERLQGVTDGRCLLASRTTTSETVMEVTALGDDDCSKRAEDTLIEELAGWQQSQALRRLAILSRSAQEVAPDLEKVDGYEQTIEVLQPEPETLLKWRDSAGQITIQWKEIDGDFWIEYVVGSGVATVKGAFRAESNPMIFGPFPIGFWNDLSRHNPFRFRLIAPTTQRRSRWVEFRIEEAE